MRMIGRQMLVHRCQWVSMKPGMQIMPAASITVAFAVAAEGTAPTETIEPLRTCTSPRS